MYKTLIEAVNLLAIITIICFPFLKTRSRGFMALGVITLQVVLSSIVACAVFYGGAMEYSYIGSMVTGLIPIRIDYLSAWFMLIISFTFLTGSWYGFQYMKQYVAQSDNLAMHAIALILVYTSLIDICIVQNGMALLVTWEIMALGSFVIIIFEHYKTETLKAGINFLIQSHVCILFLTLGFMWVKVKTGSFDFNAITTFSLTEPSTAAIGLFMLFFFGFAIKAGFVPFHTWLPLAHPAAPAHISGIMSGVIIKIGIYGILRMVLLVKCNMVTIGYFILFLSAITGVYGVILAIIQHNLKKLLAYHSIENIGIIGMGIGLGCLGMGFNNQILIIAGFAGALLHTLNHSLFKSLLFFSAGNIYLARHTMQIETLGGLLKYIPRTGYLFLIGSLAICGLPPFNGFVSEFFIYSALFKGLFSDNMLLLLFLLFSIIALVLIGGLALICFTKAFGIVFLGTPREAQHTSDIKENALSVLPLYLIAGAILFIGLFPMAFAPMLIKTAYQYQPTVDTTTALQVNSIISNISVIGWYSMAFILLTGIIFTFRHLVTRNRQDDSDTTWCCGYTGDASKMQYTASSFIRAWRKIAEPILLIKKVKKEATGLYPDLIKQETHPEDRVEKILIDNPIYMLRGFMNRFTFLQNGNLQAYILYGLIFVTLILLLPLILGKIVTFVHFLNQI